MKNKILPIAIASMLALGACSGGNGNGGQSYDDVEKMFDTTVSGMSLHLETMPVEGGWGYIIAVNGRKMIAQDVIPVLEGNYQFKTSGDAFKIGQTAVRKMARQSGLPTLFIEDLISAGIVDEAGNLK